MDNEKLNNEELEVTEETTEEVVEEVAEDTEEVAETVEEEVIEETEVEGIAEVTEDAETVEEDEVTIVQIWQCPECETVCDDAVCSVCGAECELIEIEATAGEITEGPRKNIGAIIGGVVAVVVALAAILWYFGIINPYEIGYVDVSGVTLEELADQSGYSLKEYKKVNGLSWLMPKSTNENAVRSNVKLKKIIPPGMTLDSYKEQFGWDDSITENSTIGEALNVTKLSVRLGVKEADEETANQVLLAFREYYGFGDEVTLDTLYKDVRVAVDKKTRETRIEQEKAAKEAEKKAEKDSEAEVETKDAEEEPETEEPAEDAAAEEEAAE